MKRAFDLCCSVVALLLLGPWMLAVILLVLLCIGRPVFFTQMRPGLRGAPFRFIKFRTMTNKCGSDGTLLPDEDRLVPLGRFLRKTSLDELPSLWNVLRGDMSMVGPRPLLMRYLPLYSADQARRHEVKPGVTGWAQINGRNTISWEEKFGLDVWYVDNHSIWLDIRILVMTIPKTLFARGISADGHATMPEFFGSENAE